MSLDNPTFGKRFCGGEVSDDCPYCSEYFDFCGCDWYHSLEHVREKHPDKLKEFEVKYLQNNVVNSDTVLILH